ncbi:hypothetical protein [Halorubrum halophilum]|uniref:hypothetical protein n=1 Tax=Halorubrum halophilum TaxID=413816 RepID=UPI0019298FB4|nr:hypothetical protein [Halorubrum halophilum]
MTDPGETGPLGASVGEGDAEGDSKLLASGDGSAERAAMEPAAVAALGVRGGRTPDTI